MTIAFQSAARLQASVLSASEKRLLVWIARRLPAWVTSDQLSVLALLGMLGAGASYWLASSQPVGLVFAVCCLAVNWFGDSLDGTLARVRRIERPKYGYYIDHMVDAVNTAVIGAGIGLSPYVSLPIAMTLVILYLCLSINVYLESSVHGEFDLGFGLFGPTEVRLLLVVANTALYAGAMWANLTGAQVARIANVVFVLVSAAMLYVLFARFRINLIRLARIEPPRRD
jgi:phosphatidylglycerophosphate synthase